MSKSKLYILASTAGLVGSLGLASLTSSNIAYAEGTDSYSPVIQKIIERFNLNKDDVDAVIKEVRTQRMEERADVVEERLTKAVSENKITAIQKTLILAKLKQWQDEKLTWSDLSKKDRMEKVEEHREEMEQWAKDNNINLHGIIGFGRALRNAKHN